MTKTIKFDLPMNQVNVATLDDLRDHFTPEIIKHYRSSRLACWLRSRDWTQELAAVEALAADDDATVLKELCRIFEVEADDDAIAEALAEAMGVPGIRTGQMPRKLHVWRPGDTLQDCPVCPKLVVVPSGSFMMGSSEEEEGRDSDESPVHEVRIDYRLAVGMYPVTFDEWDACVSDGGCRGDVADDEGWGRGTRPVINVDWSDVRNYTEWLRRKTGKKGYRLLSESEWEYVARAGTVTRYWWGDMIGRNRANCNGCGSRWDNEKTSPVGSFSANAFGLYDVHGNVNEWVHGTWSHTYNGTPTDGSSWQMNDHRDVDVVIRGGSWDAYPENLRSANRDYVSYHWEYNNLGFRVARTQN